MGTRVVAGTPGEVSAQIQTGMRMAGATIVVATDTEVSGTLNVKRRPSVILAILLFLLCIIPMVIYLIAASKDQLERFTVTLAPAPAGTTVQYAGGPGAVRALNSIVFGLPA